MVAIVAAEIATEVPGAPGCGGPAIRAVSARFDPPFRSFVVEIGGGGELRIPFDAIRVLAGVETSAAREVAVTPDGLAVHWPRLRLSIEVENLLHPDFRG